MVNAWVEHVRNFAKKNGISYGCAVSNAECKASYHKQKARNAKKTRTPEQETEGMGAEDTDAVKKAKKKKKKKLIIKEANIYKDDKHLQQMSYAYYVLNQIRIMAEDQKKPPSKSFMDHLDNRIDVVTYSKYKQYMDMTDDQLEDMYSAEADFEVYPDDVMEIADDFGMDILYDGDTLTRTKLNKQKNNVPTWVGESVKEHKRLKSVHK